MKSVTSKVRRSWNQCVKSISHRMDSSGGMNESINHRQDLMTHW
jgi:hypothetical protein